MDFFCGCQIGNIFSIQQILFYKMQMDFKKYKKGIQVSKQDMLCLLGEGTLFSSPCYLNYFKYAHI
jgi:hypothetical protein